MPEASAFPTLVPFSFVVVQPTQPRCNQHYNCGEVMVDGDDLYVATNDVFAKYNLDFVNEDKNFLPTDVSEHDGPWCQEPGFSKVDAPENRPSDSFFVKFAGAHVFLPAHCQLLCQPSCPF